MHQKFPYGKRDHYPHMKPADVEIWNRFIDKYPKAYDEVSYDFGMGEGPGFSTLVSPETGGDDLELYLKKADVLGFKGREVDVIEVRPRADMATIGNACCYRKMWHAKFCDRQICQSVIITDSLRANMAFLCKEMGVKIIVV